MRRGCSRFEVELDSLLLVHILIGKVGCPWSVYKEVQQFFSLKDHVLWVRHCLHQANQVADALSNVGCSHGGEEIYTFTAAIPAIARGAMCLDRIGVPSVRRIRYDQLGE